MADTAVHLEQEVLPAVPIRHWIGSLPWGLRALLGYDRKLCAQVVGAFVEEVLRSLRQRAKRLLGLGSVAAAHGGAVAAIQRTDGAMRLNVHVHLLAIDGVYVRERTGGALVFHPLPPPTRADVTAARAAAGDVDDDDPVAEVRGVNVHAKQKVDGRDRAQLERLCRYITRPPLAQERLTRRADGRLELELKKVWRDGTRALVLEPLDLLTRLVAAVPPPRLHLVRYFGVLSSHSSLRKDVVPRPASDPSESRPPDAPGDQLELRTTGNDDDEDRPAPRKRWAWLLAHVFRDDLDTCSRCGGPMRWLEAATSREAIARLLAKHGLAPLPPPPRRPPFPGQLELPFPR